MATFMPKKFNKYWDCYSIVLSFTIILDPRYKFSHVDAVFRYLNANTVEAKVKNVPNTCFLTFDTGNNLKEGDIMLDDIDLYNFAKECSSADFHKDRLYRCTVYEDCDDDNED
ncbi:hypothetical protein M9H77_29636 [Catharanthus roseus]|uniref:Uncharacterized protein n=1 Tax=Catharanthus roseus TaxID=4058 RepID=A0ACB9ZVD7_CATRO|nr:hypothetical protein M9H77_29636 [Catharanthus roseus]